MLKMNLQLFGGRGGSSGVYSMAQAVADGKRLKTLNQQIGKLERSERIRSGNIDVYNAAGMGVTAAGRRRWDSAIRNADKDRARLPELINERDQINRRLERWRRRNS